MAGECGGYLIRKGESLSWFTHANGREQSLPAERLRKPQSESLTRVLPFLVPLTQQAVSRAGGVVWESVG